MIRSGFSGPGSSRMTKEEVLAWGKRLDEELATGKRCQWQLSKDEQRAVEAYSKYKSLL